MTTTKQIRINSELDAVMKDLLASVKKKPSPGEEPMSLGDKMKIVDRVLKWEAIKAKLDDGDWGSGFKSE